ncbi:MAG: RT0821/Lpp0805 family surface protein, partial [Candidatus Thiodiazotropha taylori]
DTAGTSLVLRRSGTAGGLVRTIKNLVAILSLMALTATASALGLRLEEFTPVKYFTKEDWSQAKQVAKTALEQGKLDETFDWHNESTGHRGSYTVLRRVELDGRNCGDLLIKHKAGPASARGDYRFCQMPSGEWKAMGRTPSD